MLLTILSPSPDFFPLGVVSAEHFSICLVLSKWDVGLKCCSSDTSIIKRNYLSGAIREGAVVFLALDIYNLLCIDFSWSRRLLQR